MYVSSAVWEKPMQEIADAFLAEKDYGFDFTFTVSEVKDGGTTDDGVMMLRCSQFLDVSELVFKGGLQEITITENDLDPRATNRFVVDGKTYGIPLSSNNGCALFYDGSLFGEEDVATFDHLFAKAKEKGVKVGDYFEDQTQLLSFFSKHGAKTTQSHRVEGRELITSTTSSFASQNGLEAAKLVSQYCAYLPKVGDRLGAGFGGTWYYDYGAKSEFGENLKVAPIPKLREGDAWITPPTSQEDIGIIIYNTADKPEAKQLLNDLANALASEDAQRKYLEAIGPNYVPTNLAAREDYPLDIRPFIDNMESSIGVGHYQLAVYNEAEKLYRQIKADNGACDEAVLTAALQNYDQQTTTESRSPLY